MLYRCCLRPQNKPLIVQRVPRQQRRRCVLRWARRGPRCLRLPTPNGRRGYSVSSAGRGQHGRPIRSDAQGERNERMGRIGLRGCSSCVQLAGLVANESIYQSVSREELAYGVRFPSFFRCSSWLYRVLYLQLSLACVRLQAAEMKRIRNKTAPRSTALW